MAPYRGTTYHLQEYRNRRGRGFRSERELFNYTHSSLHNVIERTFGVWKARFRILKTINRYPMTKQVMIPVACAIIHNFIHMYRNGDRLLDQYSQDGVPVADIDPPNVDEDINDNTNHEGQPLGSNAEVDNVGSVPEPSRTLMPSFVVVFLNLNMYFCCFLNS